jgi:hypothetical protein
VPIRWVYLLSSDDSDRIQCEALRGVQRFQTLLENTYSRSLLQDGTLKSEHLRRSGQLAVEIHLARVSRPRQGFDLDTLIERLLADIAENS